MDQTQTPTQARRRWTVRKGTDGQGRGLFEVYATTMEEARASVVKSAEESGDLYLRALVTKGFTVHALAPGAEGSQVLWRNVWVRETPAPDFPRELMTAEDIIPSAATHSYGPATV